MKKIKKLFTFALACLMVASATNQSLQLWAQEANKITLSDRVGPYYGQTIATKEEVNPPTTSQDPSNVIVKEAQVQETTSPYQDYPEVVDERSVNSTTYDLGNGSFVKEVALEPIYKETNGTLTPIDNTLENVSMNRSAPVFQTKDGLYDLKLTPTNYTLTNQSNQSIQITPLGADFSYSDHKDYVMLYSEAYKNTDVQLSFHSDKVFTTYVLHDAQAPDVFETTVDLFGLQPKQKEDYIDLQDEKGKSVYKLVAPRMSDELGQASKVKVSYKLEDDAMIVTYAMDKAWMKDTSRVFPVQAISTINDTDVELELSSSYIRSAQPYTTSVYQDLFVGFDDTSMNGFEYLGSTRAFLNFGDLGLPSNQKITKATLSLHDKNARTDLMHTSSIQAATTSTKIDTSSVNWANQPSATIFSTNPVGTTDGKQKIDVKEYVQALYENKSTTLRLSANPEVAPYYGMVYLEEENNENRPTLSIYYREAWDVDPALGINVMDQELRIFGKKDIGFHALSLDGIAKPNAQVVFDLKEKKSDGSRIQVASVNAIGLASEYFMDPIYKTNPIANTQTYPKEEINYTTNYVYEGGLPKFDTFYEYQMRVNKLPENSNKQLFSDGLIKYQVKLGDTLKSIAAYYGVEIAQIKTDNNLSTNEIKENQVLLVRFKKDNPKVSKDVYTPPLKLKTYEAKYVYRGPTCYGTCYVGDPINASNGNYYHESTDFQLKDYEDVAFKRTYNSTGPQVSGMFGNTFTSDIEQYLSQDKDGNVLFFRGDGKILQIKKQGASYIVDKQDAITYQKVGNTYEIQDLRTQELYIFDDYGTLIKITNAKGFETKLQYNAYGQLHTVAYGNKQVTLSYNADNLVSEVTMPNGSKTSYTYENRRLVRVVDARGASETYTYDANNFLVSITDKNGHKIADNTYDEHGVVLSQRDGNGHTIHFDYNNNQTKTTYDDGSESTFAFENNHLVQASQGDQATKNLQYDALGNLLSSTDAAGNETTYTYQGFDLTSKTTADGLQETYTYNDKHQLLEHVFGDGRVESFTYQGKDITKHVKVDGTSNVYSYDANHRVLSDTNEQGVVVTYTYSGNQIATKTSDNGLVETFVYDANGNVLKESDNQGKTQSYEYTKDNLLARKQYSDATSEEFGYDGNKNITNYKNRVGVLTTYTYDNNNQEIQSNVDGFTTKTKYNEHGQIVESTDVQGRIKQTTYDARGNVVRILDEEGQETLHTYDELGHVLTTTNALGMLETYVYENDNLISSIAADGLETTYVYDALGQEIKQTFPNGTSISKTYQGNQLLSIVNEFGTKTTYTYDAYGRETKAVSITIDGKQSITSKRYNRYGYLIEETIDGAQTTYTYDVYGQLVKEVNALKATTTMSYDYDGNVIQKVDALGGVYQTLYDGQGQVLRTIDENGNTITNTYNALGQTTSTRDALGFVTTNSYNDKAQLVKQVNALGDETSFTYDDCSRLLTTSLNGIVLESKIYDAYGQEVENKTLTSHLSTSYDVYGRKKQTKDELSGVETTYEYDIYGNEIRATTPQGTTSKAYDLYRRLVKTTNIKGVEVSQTYDASSNILTQTSSEGTITYTYNDKNQLVSTTDALGLRTSYQYDVLGQVILETQDEKITETTYDLLSRVIQTHDTNKDATQTTTYDKVGNVICTTDALGNATKHQYDANNQVVQTIDANGNATSYAYDASSNLIQTTNALGYTTQTSFNAFSQKVMEVDERGFATNYTYNDEQQLVEVKDKLGNASKLTYNEAGQVTSILDAKGNLTRYTYDAYGNVIEEQGPDGVVTTKVYDNTNNLIQETKGEKTTSHTFNQYDQLVEVKENKVVSLKNTYNEHQQIIRSENALNASTTYAYDLYGNVKETNDKGSITRQTYNVYGELVQQVENNTLESKYTYDKNSKLIQTKVNNEITNQVELDANGNIVHSVDQGLEQTIRYNGLNQVVGVSMLDEQNTLQELLQLAYDESGNVIEEIDAKGNKQTKSYDAMNQLMKTTDKLGNTNLFAYDELGNLSKAQNEEQRVVNYTYNTNNQVVLKTIGSKQATYQYDIYGQLVEETNEFGYKHSYAYDLFGNKIKEIKPDHSTISYAYDANHQLLQRGDETFVYDDRGNVIKATNQAGSVTTSYNAFDLVTQVVDTNNQTMSYTYNQNNELQEIRYPNQSNVSYTYHNGRLQDVKRDNQSVAHYEYTKRGELKSVVQPNLTTTYGYDALGRNTTQSVEKQDKTVYNKQVSYDANDNVLQEKIDGKTNTYTYNTNNELATSKKWVNNQEVSTTYGYDLYGNKQVTSSLGEVKTYQYNDKNQLSKVETKEGTTSYHYNANGNVETKVNAKGDKETFSYDAQDRLIAHSQGAFVTSYTYDAQDERIAQSKQDVRDYVQTTMIQGTQEATTYEDVVLTPEALEGTFDILKEQVAKKEASGNVCVVATTQSSDTLTSERSLYQKAPEVTTYVVDRNREYSEVVMTNDKESIYGLGLLQEDGMEKVSDSLNNIILTNKDNQTQTIHYSDYGQASETQTNQHAYQGELQEESGLLYIRARYYDPSTGTFLQIDNQYAGEKEQVNTQNRYNYALSNPNKYVDRNGKSATAIGGMGLLAYLKVAIAAVIAGVVIVVIAAAASSWNAIASATNKAIQATSKAFTSYQQRVVANQPQIQAQNEAWANGGDVPCATYTMPERYASTTYDAVDVLQANNNSKAATSSGSASQGTTSASPLLPKDPNKDKDKNKGKVKAEDIKFTDKFSLSQYSNQIAERGWTTQSIADAINNPVKVINSINNFTGNLAKVYFINDTHYVVVDTITNKIVQVSDLFKKFWLFTPGYFTK